MSSAESASHAALDYFPVVDDCIEVGGEPLTHLAERAGGTPFYVYDRTRLDTRINELRSALPAGVSLHYAVKANPMPALLAYLAARVDGMDLASEQEMRLALDAGVSPERLSFAGPGKRPPELRAAVAAGVTVILESPGELERLAGIAQELGRRPRVAVRVNPDFELKASGMKMGGGPKVFGIDAETVPSVLARIGALDLDFRGLHVYTGSQNLRAEAIIEAQQRIVALALELSEQAPTTPAFLNIGGGFGIPYFAGEQALALEPIGEALEQRQREVRERLGSTELIVELGRYLVGEAGLYVASVVDRKVSRDHPFLVTDGGLHHHLAASGNFGQVIRKNYPVVVGNRFRGSEREVVTVTGPLCTPLDLIADRMAMARAEPGDLIAVYQSGAYGLTASPTGFLSHPPPAEMLVG